MRGKTQFILILTMTAFRLFAQPALPTTNQTFAPIANPYSGSWIYYTTNAASGLGFLNGASIPLVMTVSNDVVAYVNAATNGFVTAAVTNGLATTNFVTAQGYVTGSVTNGLATIGYVNAATNGFVTSGITNGLATIAYVNTATNALLMAGLNLGFATTNFVLTQGYVTASVTNGLATIGYVNAATNGFVTSGITNGLATIAYVNAATNGLVTAGITNGLATTNFVTAQGYVTVSVTNGLATTNFVASQGYTTVKTVWSGTSGGTAVPANKTVFWPPNNNSAVSNLVDGAGAGTRAPATRTMTLTNLYLIISAAPGALHTNTLTIMTNGVASPLAVSIFNTGITATNNKTIGVTVPAGAEIGVKIVTQTGATAANWEWSFEGD